MNRSKLIVIVVLALLGVLFLVTTFYRGKSKKQLPAGYHGVVVKKVEQTSNYTYISAEENGKEYWMAVNSMEVKPGDSLYYSKAGEMKDFHSRELNRSFPSIYFVEDASSTLPQPQQAEKKPLTPQKPTLKKWEEVSVVVPAGGISLAKLYENPGIYSGKPVIIRGMVTKYNAQIMKKNWLHIQDGTEFGGKYDLTVTSLDSALVGKMATFKGTITLNKDFGSGYFYVVIMEDARISDVK